jgi:hypothetical protein
MTNKRNTTRNLQPRPFDGEDSTSNRSGKRKKGGVGKDILGKSPGESFLAAEFLAADKRVDCDCDGAVNVLRRAEIRQSHLAKGLGDTHDRFKMTDLVVKDQVSFLLLREFCEQQESEEHTVMG